MREATLQSSSALGPLVHRAVTLDQLSSQWEPDLNFAVLIRNHEEQLFVEKLRDAGLALLASVESTELEPGDVFVLGAKARRARVLFRESDTHHTLFMTNRCNSRCLMCSQPPTPQDDSWLVDEAMATIAHMRVEPHAIGFTGGEPLLLGQNLRRLLDAMEHHHPSTAVEVLTNGRLLSRSEMYLPLFDGLRTRTHWLVPLYGHVDFIHDFVVQSRGAFEETIAGLLVLRERGQAIQLRIVLIEPVLKILPELCTFIGRNLPFVREVAIMACEPSGYAMANRQQCEVDLTDWSSTLQDAALCLRRQNVPFRFMNAPLCSLPRSLWPHANQSISDWKNVYADECRSCSVRATCCGLFASHIKGWKPCAITPVAEAA